MSGRLGLSSPWARQAIPSIDERRDIESRVPTGYTVQVYVLSNRSTYGIRVIEQGETMYGNRVVWGGDPDRRYFRDVRQGIDVALDWIAAPQGSAPALDPVYGPPPHEGCGYCANDLEQCHADMSCDNRAWANGRCGPHQPDAGAYR